MKHLFKYFKTYRAQCFLSPFLKLVEALFDLLVPFIISDLIDNGIGQDREDYILSRFLILGGLALLGIIVSVTAQYFASAAAAGFAGKVRRELFDKLQSFSYLDTDRIGVSSMITRLTSDINQLQSGVNWTLRLFLRSPVIVFGAVICAFFIDTNIALIFLATSFVLLGIIFAILLSTLPKYKQIQQKLDNLTVMTRENVSGVRVIRAFRHEQTEEESFDRANRIHITLQKAAGRISALLNPVTFFILNAVLLLIIYLGGVRVEAGSLTTGQVIALVNYMSQILVELIKLANTIITVTRSVACGNRIGDILTMPSGLPKYKEGDFPDGDDSCAVTFKDVSFSYTEGGEDNLDRISFRARPGETVGIIGGTGSGKTTLVNLIPRFYDVKSGQVLINGQDVRVLDEAELRGSVGIVPQKAVLFKGTVRDNLKWGNPDATDEELWHALEQSEAAEIVRKRPEGLDAPVEQDGNNYSGGQKQRLTIARALCRKPSILILDDSASALDLGTESRLRSHLKSLDFDPTVFIVSQRVSSIRHADLILVLNQGRLEGAGTHDSLMESCPLYREIEQSQSGGGLSS